MRQGHQNNRNSRQRSRGRRPSSGGNSANKVYDSNGPDVRVRGSAQTVADKYLQLAGDAQSQGDRIKTESYFQHAEHYLRIVAANQAANAQKQAEKEKVAEEHAARVRSKKAKAAAESEQNAAPSQQSSEPEKEDNWQGHQPEFLQRDDALEPEKVKKPKRKPAKRKSTAKSNGNGTEVSKDDASIEVRAPAQEETVTPEPTSAS